MYYIRIWSRRAIDKPGRKRASKRRRAAVPQPPPGPSEGTVRVSPDPYERLQAARTVVKALKDERASDEHWVKECRVAVERAQRRARELQAAVDRATEPADEARHRGFAKRV